MRWSLKNNRETKNVASTVRALISPLADEMGYYIWDVEFVKEGADRYLRITIDNEEGINIEDCEKFHRGIDPLLDEADPIPDAYILEVSSPGIERDITLPWHITACEGEEVEVRLFAPLEGSRKYNGTLLGFEGGETDPARPVLIKVGENTISIPYDAISKMKTLFDFDSM